MQTPDFLYPLKLIPVAKTALWGGKRLIEAYGKSYDGEKLAETWELSSRTSADSAMIENGTAAGMLLCDYFADLGKSAIGKRHTGDRFPLLIKWIDAADKLSVQVHPADDYAKKHENDLGKTEMWYIAEAKEGARLIYGMKDGVSKEAFRAAVEKGEFVHLMKELPVSSGDVVFIPAGMLHAIGEGILIAEIQESSDVTYRFYDYERRGSDGKLRPLHVEKALDVLRAFEPEEIEAVRYARATDAEREDASLLCHCPYFRVRSLSLDGKHETCVEEDSFLHLLCTEGEGSIRYEGESYPFQKGDSYLLPATLGKCVFAGHAHLLLTDL